MDSSLAIESRLLICHSLPASFSLASLIRAGAPAICEVANIGSIAAMAKQTRAASLVLIGMRSFDRGMAAACRSLRDNPVTTKMPVCVLAEGEARKSRLEVLGTGVSEFLESPWDHQEVELRLRKYWDEKSGRCLHADSTLNGASKQLGWQQELVWAAQQYLAHCHNGTPAYHDLARLMGVTVGRLTGAFRHVLGISVYDYLRQQNMALAEALLRDGRLRVLDIAEMCGYANASNFTAAFREFTGMVPSVYRGHAPIDAASAPCHP